MKQASSTITSTNLSPEFTTWLAEKKNGARLHRIRMAKMAAAFFLIATALVLLRGQPDWVQQVVEAASSTIKP